MSYKINPTTGELDYYEAATGGGGGGSTLSPSYHITDAASATVTYSGINSASSSTTNANWSVVKLVLSGNNRETRTVYTATGQWANRASLTYTTSLAYSN